MTNVRSGPGWVEAPVTGSGLLLIGVGTFTPVKGGLVLLEEKFEHQWRALHMSKVGRGMVTNCTSSAAIFQMNVSIHAAEPMWVRVRAKDTKEMEPITVRIGLGIGPETCCVIRSPSTFVINEDPDIRDLLQLP